MVKDRHNVRLIGRVMTVSATLILVLVLFVLLLTRSTNASTTPLITTYTFTEVATGSSFPIMLTANVPSGRYSGCLVSLYYKIEGTGAATSARPGSYPGIEVLNLGGGTYFLRAPACSGGRSIEPGLHSLAHFTIQANSVGSIRFNTEPGRTPIIDGGGATFSPKVTYVNNDVCPNITGVQTSIPAGMIKDSSGNCVNPPPPDVCPNIAGIQTSIPAGMIKDSSGNCVNPPPPDVCPNIAGIQASVPTGMIKDSSGNCVKPSAPVVPNPPTPVAPAPSPPSAPSPGGSGSTTRNLRQAPVEVSLDEDSASSQDPVEPEVEKSDSTGTIDNVLVSPQIDAMVLSWATSVPLGNMKVEYVADGSDDESTVYDIDSDESSHSVTLPSLSPVTVYNFRISGVMEDGTEASYWGRATTRGYPVVIRVKNGDSPLMNTKITVGGYDYITNDDGLQAFELPPGEITVVVFAGGPGEYKETIEVKEIKWDDPDSVPMQNFDIDISPQTSVVSMVVSIGVAVVLGVLLAVILFRVWKGKKRVASEADEWQPLTGVYSSVPASVPTSLPPVYGSGLQSNQGYDAYSQPPAPQQYYDPYANLAPPQQESEVEDMYQAARREGRFNNVK